MPYIPRDCHQQGRHKVTGIWTPRRVQPADFVKTYPTGPAPLEAAHAASEHTEPADGDKWLTTNQLRERAANRIAAVVSAVFVLLIVVLVAKSGGWQ